MHVMLDFTDRVTFNPEDGFYSEYTNMDCPCGNTSVGDGFDVMPDKVRCNRCGSCFTYSTDYASWAKEATIYPEDVFSDKITLYHGIGRRITV